MKCPNCNNEIIEGLNFCTTCGYKVEEKPEKIKLKKRLRKERNISIDQKDYYKEEIKDNSVEIKEEVQEIKLEETKNRSDDVIKLANKSVNNYVKISPSKDYDYNKSKNILYIFIGILSLTAVAIIIFFLLTRTNQQTIISDFMNSKEEMTNNNIGKSSSMHKPLQVGSLGLSSMYNSIKSDYLNVDVKISNIYRGSIAKELVSNYKLNNPTTNLGNLANNMEWVAVEYEITLNDFDTPDIGVAAYLDLQISGLDSSNIVYKGKEYRVNNYNIAYEMLKKGETGKAINVYELPKGCTNYILKFGSVNKTIAYFRGI